jgi:hypothetical protein
VDTLRVFVMSVQWYASYEIMLRTEKLHNCLPRVKSMTSGCKIYRSFPGAYREKAHGVLAFRISNFASQPPPVPLSPPHSSCSRRVTFNTPCKRKRDDGSIVTRQSKLQKRLVFSSSGHDSIVTRQSKLQKRLTFSSLQRQNIQIFPKLSHNVPPKMFNPYNSLKHQMVPNMCYINSVLQLLVSSDVCINHCNNIKGPLKNVLSCMRAWRCSTNEMDGLLSHDAFQGDNRKFTLGSMECAMEFMNWCVDEIKLHDKSAAVTLTHIEQRCTTCKQSCLAVVRGGPRGHGNASCFISVNGNITDHGDTDVRVQNCWQDDCPSVKSLSENVVQFREIRKHGDILIYRWKLPCISLQLQNYLCLTVKGQRNSKRRKYQLCGFTVFDQQKQHYTTYRYVADTLYHCDDHYIGKSNHTLTFPSADKHCVLAIYEMIDVNTKDVATQAVTECLSKCVTRPSLGKRGNLRVPIPSLISTSVEPATVTGDVSPRRRWTAVHGDGFCWIYAFLVAVGMLHTSDFPHGNLTLGPPSAKARQLSRAIAPYAFPANANIIYPEYEDGHCSRMGTFGGDSNFMNLLKRIRPSFRFFILDHTHTWVRRALVMREPHNNHAGPHYGTDLPSLRGNQASDTYLVNFENGYGAPRLQMIHDATAALPHDKYVLRDDTDVVICWESANHFNALSRSTPELQTKSFLDTIINSPELISMLFPPSNDTMYDCRESDSDMEIVSPDIGE